MRDTPLDRSALENLKSRSLVEKAGKKHEMSSLTGRETVQQRYVTKKHNGPFHWLDERTDLPRTTFEKFAARPSADLYVMNVVFDDVSVVPQIGDGVTRVEEDFGLDVQVVTVAAEDTDTSEYPGRVVTVDVDDLTNTSSDVARAIPSADILSVQVGPEHAGAAADLIEAVQPEYRVINADSGVFVDRAREFLLHRDEEVSVPLPKRERPTDKQQRMLTHFAPGVIVDDEVTFEAGDDGQASLDPIIR